MRTTGQFIWLIFLLLLTNLSFVVAVYAISKEKITVGVFAPSMLFIWCIVQIVEIMIRESRQAPQRETKREEK